MAKLRVRRVDRKLAPQFPRQRLFHRLAVELGHAQVLDEHAGGGKPQHALPPAKIPLGQQLLDRLDEEVEPRPRIVADVGRDIGMSGGDELELLALFPAALHLDQPQAVAAEVHADRIAFGRKEVLNKTEHLLSNPSKLVLELVAVDLRFTGKTVKPTKKTYREHTKIKLQEKLDSPPVGT